MPESYIRKFEVRRENKGAWEKVASAEWTDYRGLMVDPFLRKTKEVAEAFATETGSYRLIELEEGEPFIEGHEETCLRFSTIKHEWEVS